MKVWPEKRTSHNWNLLVRYLNGECTARETEEVVAKIAADPEVARTYDDLKRIWEIARFASDEPFEDDVAARLLRQRIEAWEERGADEFSYSVSNSSLELVGTRKSSTEIELRPSRPPVSPAVHFRHRRDAGITLLAGIVLTVVLVWVFSVKISPHEHRRDAQVVSTTSGQRLHLRLFDGTEVDLSNESRLMIPGDFGKNARNIELEGQAFLSVSYDPARPFTVQTRGTRIQVFGTRFGIRSYPDEQQVVVAVEEGRVAVWPADAEVRDSVHLRTGQLAFTREKEAIVVTDADLTPYLAWREGKLVFSEAPLRLVARTLERWYDVKIRFENPAHQERHLTAEFSSEPLRRVLDSIAMVMDLRYDEKEGEIVFH